MLEKELESLGLTKGESKAYLALLSLGSSTVGPIARKTGISYSKIYEVLQRLLEKGLASFIIKEKTRYYQSVEPSRITEYLEKKEKEINEQKKKFQLMLPELKRAVEQTPRQEAEVFVGLKGLKTAYELLLKDVPKETEIYFFYVFDKENQTIIDKFYGSLPHYKKNKWKGISSSQYEVTPFVKEMQKNIEFKRVNIPIPANIDMTEDKIIHVTFSGKPTAVLIHSKELATTYRKYFEHIWANY